MKCPVHKRGIYDAQCTSRETRNRSCACGRGPSPSRYVLHPPSAVRFAYLPTRDQTQILFSRPRSSATAICSLKQTLPAVNARPRSLDLSVGRCLILAFFPLADAAPAISRVVGRSVLISRGRKKNRGKPHVFPNIIFGRMP